MGNGTITAKQLDNYYSQGLSMMDIAKKLRVSAHKITYWMAKYGIERRSIGDSLYRKYNPHGDPFKIKPPTTIQDAYLYGLGLGIYWGEGNKADKYSLRVGTTDPKMILAFRKFLERFCSVPRAKFKYSLMCFKDSNPDMVKKFWIKKLNLLPDQIGKVTTLKPLGKGKYKKISTNGVCTIYCFNIKLKKWLMDQLGSIKYNRKLEVPT